MSNYTPEDIATMYVGDDTDLETLEETNPHAYEACALFAAAGNTDAQSEKTALYYDALEVVEDGLATYEDESDAYGQLTALHWTLAATPGMR